MISSSIWTPHPDDAHALAALKNALAERRAAVAAFEKEYGALTHDGLLFTELRLGRSALPL